jgi:hypothetical protein
MYLLLCQCEKDLTIYKRELEATHDELWRLKEENGRLKREYTRRTNDMCLSMKLYLGIAMCVMFVMMLIAFRHIIHG